MNLERLLSVSSLFGLALAASALAGCTSPGLKHPLAASSGPLVVAEPPAAGTVPEEPATVVAEPLPAATGTETAAKGGPTLAEFAARPEPRSVSEVAAIEAELELVAKQRAESANTAEIAALEARAAELKRLAAAAGAGAIRR